MEAAAVMQRPPLTEETDTMKSINTWLQPVYQRVDALTVRERAIIAVTLVVATLFVWSELVLSDQMAQRRQAEREVTQLRGEVATLTAEQARLQQRQNQDPNRDLEVRLERYQKEIERVDRLLEEQTLEFISPRQMVVVLKSMIQKEKGLRLVRVESMEPVDPVAALSRGDGEEDAGNGESSGQTQTSSGAYLHALEMEFEGDYLAVLKYIRHLESLEWKFVWRSLSVELVNYPTTTARLRLETLSQSDGWIGV
jgi:MSHA biogenesis protein MshJ